jgi:hypothetical protein
MVANYLIAYQVEPGTGSPLVCLRSMDGSSVGSSGCWCWFRQWIQRRRLLSCLGFPLENNDRGAEAGSLVRVLNSIPGKPKLDCVQCWSLGVHVDSRVRSPLGARQPHDMKKTVTKYGQKRIHATYYVRTYTIVSNIYSM